MALLVVAGSGLLAAFAAAPNKLVHRHGVHCLVLGDDSEELARREARQVCVVAAFLCVGVGGDSDEQVFVHAAVHEGKGHVADDVAACPLGPVLDLLEEVVREIGQQGVGVGDGCDGGWGAQHARVQVVVSSVSVE